MLALMIWASTAKAQKTAVGLLKTIYKLAEKKKYKKINRYLYPGKVNQRSGRFKGKTMAEIILAGIKGEIAEYDDFGYSAKSLKILVYQRPQEIKPISKQQLKRFGKSFSFSYDPYLNEIAKNRPQDIWVYHKGIAFILMIKVKKRFKLVTWHEINHIAKNN